jgi:hypothetical protein
MKFVIGASMGISVSVTVEAKSEEEALQLAEEAPNMTLCWSCAEGSPSDWSTSGELDGTPEKLRVISIDGVRPAGGDGDDGRE